MRELATGSLIQRLSLSANRADGLDECTREMFSLAMLVRLGKVTEDDIRETFAVFRRLDVNDEGVLNSKSIIAGLIQKHRKFGMQRRDSSGALSTMSKNSGVQSQFMPYYQMPMVPLTTPNVYNSAPGGAMPEIPINGIAGQYMVQSERFDENIPNEMTGLLKANANR